MFFWNCWDSSWFWKISEKSKLLSGIYIGCHCFVYLKICEYHPPLLNRFYQICVFPSWVLYKDRLYHILKGIQRKCVMVQRTVTCIIFSKKWLKNLGFTCHEVIRPCSARRLRLVKCRGTARLSLQKLKRWALAAKLSRWLGEWQILCPQKYSQSV